MVSAPKLSLVDDARQVIASHRAFVGGLRRSRRLAVDLMRRTHYWVYEPATRTFSPSKFSGYIAMDFQRYDAARRGGSAGIKFDTGVAQRALTQVLGDYQPDRELAAELAAWTHSIFDQEVLEDIDPHKWRFVRLPALGAGGLAALAGGWDGSEELADSILEYRRTAGRTAPELD